MRIREAVTPTLNITPLVDVLLVLCVVLIMVAPMANKRLPVDPPPAASAIGGAANNWSLGFDGKTWYFESRAVEFEAIARAVPKGAAVTLAADSSLSYAEVMQAVDRVHTQLKPSEFSLATR